MTSRTGVVNRKLDKQTFVRYPSWLFNLFKQICAHYGWNENDTIRDLMNEFVNEHKYLLTERPKVRMIH